MHPNRYPENFWPTRDDETYVPFSQILLKVNTPNTSSLSGRQYIISINEVLQTVEKHLQNIFEYVLCIFQFYFETNVYGVKLNCNKIF